MSDLDKDLNNKLTNLFNNKRYSEIEYEIELLGDLHKQPIQILNAYAVAKASNINSKKDDLEKAAFFF